MIKTHRIQCVLCSAFLWAGSQEQQSFQKIKIRLTVLKDVMRECQYQCGNRSCSTVAMWNPNTNYKMMPYKLKNLVPNNNGGTDRIGIIAEIEPGDEEAMKAAVALEGPIVARLNANKRTFQFYREGVFDDDNCYQNESNHAVLIVGYGTDEDTGKDYWLVRNSWGDLWGGFGSMKIERNVNICGIANAASYPLAYTTNEKSTSQEKDISECEELKSSTFYMKPTP